MKKKERLTFFLLVLATACILGGCTLKSGRQKEKELRAEGIALMESGDYAAAAETFEEALGSSYGLLSDLDLDIAYYRAAALYLSGESGDAVEVYDAIIACDDDAADAYYLRGTISLEAGDMESAKSDYVKAVSCSGADYDLYLQIYKNLIEEGVSESEAAVYLENALELGGSSASDLSAQGYIYYLLGDADTAMTYLSQAADAGDEAALLYLAQIAIADGDYDTALTYVEQGLAIEDGEYLQQFTYARIALYEYEGDFESARDWMEDYIAAYPDDEDAQREWVFLETR